MKFNPIASSLFALAAMTTPTMMFGAAADLTDCCTPADKDQPKRGGNLGNQSYSSLNQINKANIASLGAVWMTSVSAQPATTPVPSPGTAETGQQTTPIVVDGVIYLDTPSGGVIAVDGATGVTKWKWQPTMATPRLRPHRDAPRRVGRRRQGLHARRRQPRRRARQGHRRRRCG